MIALGVFCIFVWCLFVTGWGLTGSAQAVADQFAGKTASAFYPLTDKYVGGGLTTILQLLIVTSSFACAMAFYDTGARYLFAFAREGVLPRALGRTRQAPRPDRRRDGRERDRRRVHARLHDHGLQHRGGAAQARTWTPLLGVLGILAVQGLCSVAIIRFFWTEARDGFHWFKTLVAPILGTLAMAGACYLLIANRGVLSGAGDSVFIKAIPWVVLVVFVAGMVLGLVMRSRSKETYAKIGRFSPEEIPA